MGAYKNWVNCQDEAIKVCLFVRHPKPEKERYGGALFLIEAKVDGTCPKPPGAEGMSAPTPTFS